MKTEDPKPIEMWIKQMQAEWQRADLPDIEVPYSATDEGKRAAEFKRCCPEQFQVEIDRSQIFSAKAFDRVSAWNGSYPGPLCCGATGTSKTRAVWCALGHLYVRQNKAFTWFPVRRLITSMEWYEKESAAEEFYRNCLAYEIIFVDDVEKLNWQFQSQSELLFSFYDWVYRNKRPCVTTTNLSRKWWTDKMGDAFVRRVFDEAHGEVKF